MAYESLPLHRRTSLPEELSEGTLHTSQQTLDSTKNFSCLCPTAWNQRCSQGSSCIRNRTALSQRCYVLEILSASLVYSIPGTVLALGVGPFFPGPGSIFGTAFTITHLDYPGGIYIRGKAFCPFPCRKRCLPPAAGGGELSPEEV